MQFSSFQQKYQLTLGLIGVITFLFGVLFFGDLSGFFGKKSVGFLLLVALTTLGYIWKEELKRIALRKKKIEGQTKDGPKPFGSALTPSPLLKRAQNSNQLRTQTTPQSFSVNHGDSTIDSYSRFSMHDDGFSHRNNMDSQPLQSQQQLFRSNNGPAQPIEKQKVQIKGKSITQTRTWGAKNEQNMHGLMTVGSSSTYTQNQQYEQLQPRSGAGAQIERRNGAANLNNSFSISGQTALEQNTKRHELFQSTFQKQGEFSKMEQIQSAIQRTKTYTFHIVKERAQFQLHNILQINRLLYEQFNLVLVEAEIAQGVIAELENRFDYMTTYKKRVNIDDLYHFKQTFINSKHCIWKLPYENSVNTKLVKDLIKLIEEREQLDSCLEIKGYNSQEIRTHVLSRLFMMYATLDCEEVQIKEIEDKTPTDMEIVAHCLFLSLNEIAHQQKDLTPCKIELFDVQSEFQTLPIHKDFREKFYFLICNRIGLEPYFMLQVGQTIFHSIPGSLSLYCTMIYYFMHLKNVVFPSLSHSKIKDDLESPAKYILNYENDFRKGYERFYF